jgi:Fic family protein
MKVLVRVMRVVTQRTATRFYSPLHVGLRHAGGFVTVFQVVAVRANPTYAGYNALEQANKANEISAWLVYFANMVLSAQNHTQAKVELLIKKAKLYDRLRGQLNARQEKVLARMFREGPDGFKGGLSAENTISITGAPRATVTRDLQDLVSKGALLRTGERKYTRYLLNLEDT